jgi:hypothetical protein
MTFGLLVTLTVLPDLAEAAPRRYRRYSEREYVSYGPRHDGLLLRLAFGLGGVAADDTLNDVTLSGGAGFFSLDLGGAVAPNLALHGRLSVNSMFEPNISDDGESFGELEDTSLSFSLLGLGLTYYLPSNFYLTGVLGLSQATFELYGDEYDALHGGGIIGDIGYEWPIGGDWGLGVAGRLELHSVRGDDERLSAAALSVLLSLTYF